MLCFLTFAQQSRQIHVNRLWSSLYKCINNAYCLEVLWYIHLCIYTYIIDILCGILCVCVCVCECGKGECVHAQSYPTLCDPMDYSPPGSSVHGILQARMLEWVAILFSRDQTHIFYVSCTGRHIFYHWATLETSRGRETELKKEK